MLEGNELVVTTMHDKEVTFDVLDDRDDAEVIVSEEGVDSEKALVGQERYQRQHRRYQYYSLYLVFAGCYSCGVAS